MSSTRIPIARPDITDAEIAAVTQVLRSDVLALGPRAEAFEQAVAELAGRRYGIACSSGTAGLHMAVVALGIRPDDEVITTPFSFVASANCILYERASPRFVDIEEETLGLDPRLVEAAAGPRTRAVVAVDVFGRPCRIDELERFAQGRGWSLIEDSCEALGSRLGERSLGSFGDVAVFAFYPNKQITTGEGGVVVTDDPNIAELLRSLRNQGRDSDATWLKHVRLGFNYRLDEMSAALGLAQVGRLPELRGKREEVVRRYEELLGDVPWLVLPKAAKGSSVDWFVYVVRLDPSIDRDRLIGQLQERGIVTRPYFSPIHLQPYWRNRFGYGPGDFPVTERVALSTLALPFSTRMSDDELATVSAALRAAVEEQSRNE